MISSLPAFVTTATELPARPVVNRPAMPVGAVIPIPKLAKLNLICFSRSVPDPRGFPR